jgi:hypothetical protein
MVIGLCVGIFFNIFFSILLFVVKNNKLFTTNYDSHNVKTRQCENLHFPHSRLTLYQNGIHFTGIKIFNKLPSYLKALVGSPKKIKRTLKMYLVPHFHKLEEFYNINF